MHFVVGLLIPINSSEMFSVNTVKLPIVTTSCKLACEQALLFGRVKRGELARWLLVSDHRSPISHHQPKTPKLPQSNHYNYY